MLVAAVGVLPILLLGSLAARLATRSLSNAVIQGNRLAAATLSDRIDTLVDRYVYLLHSISEGLGQDVAPSSQQTLDVLRDQRIAFGELTRLDLCAPDGTLLASGEPVPEECPKGPELALTGADDVYRSDVALTSDLRPQITLSVPLMAMGKVQAILRADVDLTELWTVIDAVKIGEGGRARLTDRQGHTIAHGDPAERSEVFNGQTDGSSSLIDSLLHDGNDEDTYNNLAGVNVLGVGARVPDLGWAVIIEEPTAEAFHTVTLLWRALVASGIALALVGALLGLIMARSVTRPLGRLRAQADAIAGGNLALVDPIARPTELGALSQAMNHMAGELVLLHERIKRDERLSVLARAASGLVHDLKLPLAALGMAVETATVAPDDETLRENLLSVSRKVLDKMTSMFDDLRRVTKKDEISLQLKEVDLAELTNEVTRDLRAGLTQGDRIAIELDAPARVAVGCDKRLIYRVLANLGKNALEAQRVKGPGTIGFEVRAGEGGGGVLCVRDQAVGIAKARLPQLFDSLESTKKDGWGVGLASVKAIIEQHGGRIEVESEVGKGSRFTVHLPSKPPVEALARSA
jgi:signal transduction histidine kinase